MRRFQQLLALRTATHPRPSGSSERTSVRGGRSLRRWLLAGFAAVVAAALFVPVQAHGPEVVPLDCWVVCSVDGQARGPWWKAAGLAEAVGIEMLETREPSQTDTPFAGVRVVVAGIEVRSVRQVCGLGCGGLR